MKDKDIIIAMIYALYSRSEEIRQQSLANSTNLEFLNRLNSELDVIVGKVTALTWVIADDE